MSDDRTCTAAMTLNGRVYHCTEDRPHDMHGTHWNVELDALWRSTAFPSPPAPVMK